MTATCAGQAALSATVAVTAADAEPLLITHGGTYSGDWTSTDPSVPAVSIRTDQPVTLRDATISGRGDLIDINGPAGKAQVTVENVTGVALDPGVAGLERGAFLAAEGVSALHVRHCSMFGVSFGVKILSSTLEALEVTQNRASELEDRASDGTGGLLLDRPSPGHFLFLYEDSAPNGAEIAWNQVIDTIGQSSTEDVINLFKSQGAPGAPIHVHDNYLEGFSSAATPGYTGAGLITDGDGSAPLTAYVAFRANQIVHAAGSGIEIAVGHDIAVTGNRIVSCGMDAQGNWYAQPFVNGIVVWNDYAAPHFSNITLGNNAGGLLKPAADGSPVAADQWVRTADLDATDMMGREKFTDPCLLNGQLNLAAEQTERDLWASKLTAAGEAPGDQRK